jgi:hypothetical protein
MLVPPQEVCPFSAQQSFDCPTSLPGLQQQARHKVSELLQAISMHIGKQLSTFLLLERLLMGLKTPLQMHTGLTTHFFSSKDLVFLVTNNSPNLSPYRYKNGDGLIPMVRVNERIMRIPLKYTKFLQ